MYIQFFSSRTSRFLVLFLLFAGLLAAWPALATAQAASNTPMDEWPEWRGTVESMPAGGNIGSWTVGGRVFSADSGTQFEQEHGALQSGVCAEVKYQTVGAGYRAVKIGSTEADKCGSGGGEQNSKVYARINTIPAGLIGTWSIGGVSYVANANTFFEQEHGGFAANGCVEVEYVAGTPATATKIATENDYKCTGSGGGGETPGSGELYGTIASFPAELFGQWVIGGMTFVADSATQFEQEHSAFAIDVLVEVKFYTDASAVNHATKIESKYATDGNGQDDDGNGSYEGHEGHAYGIVGVMPAGGIGTWTIAGIQYTADASTRMEQEHGAIVVGALVKVQYYLDASNNRLARKIESTNENGGVTDSSHSKLYGTIEQMPSGSFNGQWQINGVSFTADQNTQFLENNGVLAMGAYVEVEYTQNGGVNWIAKIETHVPPGAGPDQHFGSIDSTVGAASVSASQATWVIGGQSYVVTTATNLNDLNGALTPGNTALVNSYTDSTGAMVATQIRGLVLSHRVFLPATAR